MIAIKQERNNLTIVINEREIKYENLAKIMGSDKIKRSSSICYVCLSRPFSYVMEDMKKSSISTENIFFIDALSGPSGPKKHSRKCFFLQNVAKIEEMGDSIKDIMEKKKCTALIFDSISSMLLYHETFKIVKFTDNILKDSRSISKIFFVTKKDSFDETEGISLSKDLEMFADETIDLSIS